MLKSIIKLAFRSFYNDKLFSFINLLGLSVGIVVFTIIIQYASFELSYDGFHDKASLLYRINRIETVAEQGETKSPLTFYGIGPEAANKFPEIDKYARLHRADGMISTENHRGEIKSFLEADAYYTDETFFEMFSFPLIKGDVKKVLQNPTGVLISESAANRYFGLADPIGKVFTLHTEWEGGNFTVEGVFADLPENSHMKFDFLFPITDLLNNFQFRVGAWTWTNFHTYLLVKPGTNKDALQNKLKILVKENLSYLEVLGIEMELQLQSVDNIYLESDLQAEIKETGVWKVLRVVIVSAFFIIGLAWLNYINLTTARAIKRAREVGIRKVMGSTRWALIQQFMMESLMMNVLAIILGGIILFIGTPFFEEFIGKELTFNFQEQFQYWLLFLLIFIGGTLLSALYPAFYLSMLPPISALKGEATNNSKERMRQILVTLQFIASMLLLVGTAVIEEQINLMRKQELGFNLENKYIVQAPRTTGGGYWSSLEVFKSELTESPLIERAAVSFNIPGKRIFWGSDLRLRSWPKEKNISVSRTSFDYDFIPAYDIEFVAGRNFTNRFEGATAIINESARKALGFENPSDAVGIVVSDGWLERIIIGVVKDYHHATPKYKIKPLLITPFSKEQGFFTISYKANQSEEMQEYVEETFRRKFPGNAYDGFFLDDYFGSQFDSDEKFGGVIGVFSILAMFIAGLGLFGFSLFVCQSRKKEIGVRKVLGANDFNVFYIFNREIVILVLIAAIISIPLIVLVTRAWIQSFDSQISLSAVYFIVPFIALVVIASVTISSQVYRMLKAKPVDLLRNE